MTSSGARSENHLLPSVCSMDEGALEAALAAGHPSVRRGWARFFRLARQPSVASLRSAIDEALLLATALGFTGGVERLSPRASRSGLVAALVEACGSGSGPTVAALLATLGETSPCLDPDEFDSALRHAIEGAGEASGVVSQLQAFCSEPAKLRAMARAAREGWGDVVGELLETTPAAAWDSVALLQAAAHQHERLVERLLPMSNPVAAWDRLVALLDDPFVTEASVYWMSPEPGLSLPRLRAFDRLSLCVPPVKVAALVTRCPGLLDDVSSSETVRLRQAVSDLSAPSIANPVPLARTGLTLARRRARFS